MQGDNNTITLVYQSGAPPGERRPSATLPPLPREILLDACRQAAAELRRYPDRVAGIHIERPEVEEIARWALEAEPAERFGVLLDQPGAGKSVIMRGVL